MFKPTAVNMFTGNYIIFGQTISAVSGVQNSQIWSNKYLLLSTLYPKGGIIGGKLLGLFNTCTNLNRF